MNDPERITTGFESLESDEDQPLSSEELEAAFLELVTRRNYPEIEHESYRKAFEVFRALVHAVRRDYIAGETPDEVDWNGEIIDALHRKLNESDMQHMRMIAAIEDAERSCLAIDAINNLDNEATAVEDTDIPEGLLERIGAIDERLRDLSREVVVDELERLHAAQLAHAQGKTKKRAYSARAVLGKLYQVAGVAGNATESIRSARNRKLRK